MKMVATASGSSSTCGAPVGLVGAGAGGVPRCSGIGGVSTSAMLGRKASYGVAGEENDKRGRC